MNWDLQSRRLCWAEKLFELKSKAIYSSEMNIYLVKVISLFVNDSLKTMFKWVLLMDLKFY